MDVAGAHAQASHVSRPAPPTLQQLFSKAPQAESSGEIDSISDNDDEARAGPSQASSPILRQQSRHQSPHTTSPPGLSLTPSVPAPPSRLFPPPVPSSLMDLPVLSMHVLLYVVPTKRVSYIKHRHSLTGFLLPFILDGSLGPCYCNILQACSLIACTPLLVSLQAYTGCTSLQTPCQQN